VLDRPGGRLAAVLYLISSGREGFSLGDGFAANGYGDLSPSTYNVLTCFVAELVIGFLFLLVILGGIHKLVPICSRRSQSGWR
jgi:aquaporin Z